MHNSIGVFKHVSGNNLDWDSFAPDVSNGSIGGDHGDADCGERTGRVRRSEGRCGPSKVLALPRVDELLAAADEVVYEDNRGSASRTLQRNVRVKEAFVIDLR